MYYLTDSDAAGTNPVGQTIDTWAGVVHEVTSILDDYASSQAASADRDEHRYIVEDLVFESARWKVGAITPESLPYENTIGNQYIQVVRP